MNAFSSPEELLPAWERFRAATGIAPIRDDAHHAQMTQILDSLLKEAGSDEAHPAMELIDIVGDLIADYEHRHHPLEETTGLEALKFLMEQHDLKQGDLPEIGSQGVVSEILAGKRELNIRQVRALSKRFNVSPATFV